MFATHVNICFCFHVSLQLKQKYDFPQYLWLWYSLRLAHLSNFLVGYSSREECILRRSAASSPTRPHCGRKPLDYCELLVWPAHELYLQHLAALHLPMINLLVDVGQHDSEKENNNNPIAVARSRSDPVQLEQKE